MVPGNFARREKAHQRHIAQRVADDLQLSTGATKVWAPSAGAADIDRTGDDAKPSHKWVVYPGQEAYPLAADIQAISLHGLCEKLVYRRS